MMNHVRLKTYFVGVVTVIYLVTVPVLGMGQATGETTPTVAPLKLGPLIHTEQAQGCGCYIQSPEDFNRKGSQNYLFFAGYEASPAWINLNGQDLQLDLKKGPKGLYATKVGEKITRKYQGGKVSLLLHLTATEVCKQGEEGCEYNAFDVTMEVNQGKNRTEIKAKGGCGC